MDNMSKTQQRVYEEKQGIDMSEKKGLFEIDVEFGHIIMCFEKFLNERGISMSDFFNSEYQSKAEVHWNDLRDIIVGIQEENERLQQELDIAHNQMRSMENWTQGIIYGNQNFKK